MRWRDWNESKFIYRFVVSELCRFAIVSSELTNMITIYSMLSFAGSLAGGVLWSFVPKVQAWAVEETCSAIYWEKVAVEVACLVP